MSEQTFKDIANTLRELLKWSKFAGMQQLRNVLSQTLKTDTEKLIYEFSDGIKGAREVAGVARVGSHATVLAYWKKWSRVGIVEPSSTHHGRYQRICSLEEVGLEAPQMAQPVAETSSSKEMEVKPDE